MDERLVPVSRSLKQVSSCRVAVQSALYPLKRSAVLDALPRGPEFLSVCFSQNSHGQFNISPLNMSLSLHAPNGPSKSLERVEPNLMPFHIDFDGIAPISTYFLVRTADQTYSDASPTNTRRVYSAAFRGRKVHGIDVKIPTGYTGLTLRVDAASSPNAAAITSAATTSKRKRVATSKAHVPHKFAKSLTGRRAGLRRTRSETLAEVAEDDNSQNTLVADGDGGDDMYALMSEEIAEGDQISEMSTQVVEDSLSQRQMVPTGEFDSMIVWNPDVPADSTRDEFIRAIDDWTRLADVVSLENYVSLARSALLSRRRKYFRNNDRLPASIS